MSMLEIRDLEVNYGMIAAIKGVSFDVNEGEVIALIGANGAGKTTILHTITGLLKAKAGSIMFEGHELTKTPAHKIVELGMAHVPEGRRIFSHLTVLENVCTASYEKNVEKQAKDLLERLGLKDLINQKPYKLSGGERQRVAIARAVVKKPRILFADEPTASLDHHTAQEIMKIFSELQENTTIVCATHDYGILPQTARILRIKDGKVVEDETEENE